MNFALITEGPSENRIIKRIIANYFKGHNSEPDFNQIQPKLIGSKQDGTTPGGWNEVLKYCERDTLQDIFVENDYLVIQIDTDESEMPAFGIKHYKENNKAKTVEELHFEVIEKLQQLIIPEIFQKHGHKIFFAICIHTIECWLLPLYYANLFKSKNRGCIEKLNTALARNNINTISPKDKNNTKSVMTYDTILKGWNKKKDIINAAQHNPAFEKFLNSLNTIL